MIVPAVSIPRIQTHKRYNKKKTISNDMIREVLKRLICQPVKVVAIDLELNDHNVYTIRRNYKIIDGELYKRINDGNN